MESVVLHVDREESTRPNIVKCPVCEGAGSIPCIIVGRDDKEDEKKKGGRYNINPLCISVPLRDEERCNCCDGRGWVVKSQSTLDLFCHLHGENIDNDENEKKKKTTLMIMEAANVK